MRKEYSSAKFYSAHLHPDSNQALFYPQTTVHSEQAATVHLPCALFCNYPEPTAIRCINLRRFSSPDHRFFFHLSQSAEPLTPSENEIKGLFFQTRLQRSVARGKLQIKSAKQKKWHNSCCCWHLVSTRSSLSASFFAYWS